MMAQFQNESFYVAVATVIPVLVLAVTLQGDVVVNATVGYLRSFVAIAKGLDNQKPLQWLARAGAGIGWALFFGIGLGSVFLAVMGEVSSLQALADHSARESQLALSWLGMAAMLLLVLVGLATRVIEGMRETAKASGDQKEAA